MADGEQRQRRPLGARLWRAGRELLIVIVLGLIVSTVLRTFVFQMFEIPSGSMENTLLVGDRVVVQKVTGFQRGDVVVFEDPSNWLPSMEPVEQPPIERFLEFAGLLPSSSTNYLIKRVVGTAGDTVVCCDTEGRILVNGRPLTEDRYLYRDVDGTVAPSEDTFEVTVPAGRIFVMGDHRNASADSRCHLTDRSANGPPGEDAFVPTDRVVGVAFAVVHPFSRLHVLSRDDTYDQVPEPTQPPPAEPSITIGETIC